jgi:hypothetical protein
LCVSFAGGKASKTTDDGTARELGHDAPPIDLGTFRLTPKQHEKVSLLGTGWKPGFEEWAAFHVAAVTIGGEAGIPKMGNVSG